MKPDQYMKFYGKDFFPAVEGLPDGVAMGYLRAIWHYRSHTHCKGLPNDEKYLQRICRSSDSEWAYAFSVIFDNEHFFCMDENGMWHQKRAEEDYKEDTENYNKAVARGKASASKRINK